MKVSATSLAVLAAFATAQNSPGTGIEVASGYNVQVKLNPDNLNEALFEVYMLDNSWMGLVLGDNGMSAGTDMIQIKADGVNSRVYDSFSQGYISPARDS